MDPNKGEAIDKKKMQVETGENGESVLSLPKPKGRFVKRGKRKRRFTSEVWNFVDILRKNLMTLMMMELKDVSAKNVLWNVY